MAEIVCGLPVTLRLGVVNTATSLLPSRAVPRKQPPSWKITRPLAVPKPGLAALMVAVKLTPWPNTAAALAQVRVMLVPSWATICTRAAEVLPARLLSPL